MAAELKPAEDHSENPQLPDSKLIFFSRFFAEYFPPRFLRKVVAETIATFVLFFFTCGSAALSASAEQKVSSKLGASIAGGLIVTLMIYAVGHISGAHMNPAVTLDSAAARHFPWKQGYIVEGISNSTTW